jgi:predicted transcriptional regulator
LDEVHSALTELNEGRNVPHQTVVKWLRSWGKRPERKAPRA